jgi:hypothetical protein
MDDPTPRSKKDRETECVTGALVPKQEPRFFFALFGFALRGFYLIGRYALLASDSISPLCQRGTAVLLTIKIPLNNMN